MRSPGWHSIADQATVPVACPGCGYSPAPRMALNDRGFDYEVSAKFRSPLK